MTQIRNAPADASGNDFEWVNSWADASGLKAAREFAAAPVRAVTPPAKPVAAQAPAPQETTGAGFPIAPDQLERDIREIEKARDSINAAEGKGAFVLPTRRAKPSAKRALLRRQDAVPVLIGAVLAMFMLVAYGALASLVALGR
jgi:hypothetical protein